MGPLPDTTSPLTPNDTSDTNGALQPKTIQLMIGGLLIFLVLLAALGYLSFREKIMELKFAASMRRSSRSPAVSPIAAPPRAQRRSDRWAYMNMEG
ncbi:hypothetical protein C8J56DRAFT_1168899 [Mycena floridula]|nr:hypothetical protein C8J56DRAFT_1168899 [Mycena floridula]